MAFMPRSNVFVAVDRSKNCAAMRKAPIWLPASQALRIWSVLLRMPFSDAANRQLL
jgi:hypothetical protein